MLKKIIFLLSSISFFALANEPTPCSKMQGEYQRVKSSHGIQDESAITLYLNKISNTNNGYYGLLYSASFQQLLQPLVRENPQCSIIFENVTLRFTTDTKKYNCHYILSDNTDNSKFYCMKKTSDTLTNDIIQIFKSNKNEPFYNDMSDIEGVIKWSNESDN